MGEKVELQEGGQKRERDDERDGLKERFGGEMNEDLKEQ